MAFYFYFAASFSSTQQNQFKGNSGGWSGKPK
jgi:hypothetical protein